MPPAHAHAHDDDTAGGPESGLGEGPVEADAIDRLLVESDDPDRADPVALRRWWDDLHLARQALDYAGTVLAADLAIVDHCRAPEADLDTLPEDLPRVVATPSSPTPGPPGDLDPELIVRADPLLSAHGHMARLDPTAPDRLARVRGLVEAQLGEVRARRAAVDARLEDIRAIVVRRSRDGVLPWLERPA